MNYDSKKLKEMSASIAEISKYSTKTKGKSVVSKYYSPKKTSSSELRDISRYSSKIPKFKIIDGKKGIQGDQETDGSPDTPQQIADKINTLREAIDPNVIKDYAKLEDVILSVIKELKTGKNRLEAKDILNLPQNRPLDQRWHGSGIPSLTAGAGISITDTPGGGKTITNTGGSGGGGFTRLDITSGLINNANTVFGFSQQPDYILVNGIWYDSTTTGGPAGFSWNAGTLQATLAGAVGTGGKIWGFVGTVTPSGANLLTDSNGNLLTDSNGDLLTLN